MSVDRILLLLDHKENRRLLAAKDFRILMSIGDDFGDFLPDVKKNITPDRRRGEK